jgi:two-component system, NtrC family, nitrogen regulation response regulator NtrX
MLWGVNVNCNILVIDDEDNIRVTLKDILEEEGYNTLLAEDWDNAQKILLSEKIDVVLLDIWLPKVGGMEILEKLKREYPALEVVMISGHGNIELAVKSTKLGAVNFLEKPLSIEKTLSVIENAVKIKKLKEENASLKKIVYKDVNIIGESEVMKNVKEQIKSASQSNARVLITGGNGTGKEAIAHSIHLQSERASKPFVAINCAAIPENLIESELFGYEKGAFTGAETSKKGRLETAEGGTLFLDEIADMSLSTQAKMLRVLQEMEFERVGGNKTIHIDVRIIAATNKDIKEEIENKNFREDLFYRLNVIPIKVPELKDRREDIPLLVDYYITRFASDLGNSKKTIEKEAMEMLKNADWPGNVRQLINIIERLNVMVQDDTITKEDVKKYFLEKMKLGEDKENKDDESEENKDAYQNITDFVDAEKKSLKEAKGEFEKMFIIEKLKENNMNITKTAQSLQMERSHLHRKIKQYEITIDRENY